MDMFEGCMIEDLIATVERAELQARPVPEPMYVAPARAERYPVFSTYVYEWPVISAMRQIVGVA
jgi:hypothetical protein